MRALDKHRIAKVSVISEGNTPTIRVEGLSSDLTLAKNIPLLDPRDSSGSVFDSEIPSVWNQLDNPSVKVTSDQFINHNFFLIYGVLDEPGLNAFKRELDKVTDSGFISLYTTFTSHICLDHYDVYPPYCLVFDYLILDNDDKFSISTHMISKPDRGYEQIYYESDDIEAAITYENVLHVRPKRDDYKIAYINTAYGVIQNT